MTTSRLANAKLAVRPALKARMMLSGPTGAGKTRSALIIAAELAPGGRVVMLDTEKESGLTYADDFQFEHVGWEPPFDPRELATTITEAGRTYDVVIVDSTSHFWRKAGGTLDIADGKFGGWKAARPAQEDLVDAILGCGGHVILCTRSKMAHVQEVENGKQVVKKLGMAPQQDDDLEYELNVACELDMEHRLTVSKSRCIAVPVGKFFAPGHAPDFAKLYKEWLEVGEPAAPQAAVDDLVARMNALEPNQRKAVKGEFVARFGRPDHLREAQVPDATELVASFEAGPASPGGGEGEPAPSEEEAAPAVDTDGGNDVSSVEGPPPAPPEPDTQGTEEAADNPPPAASSAPGDWDDLNRLQWAVLTDIFPRDDQDELDAKRTALIHFVSDGATRSSKELTADQVAEYRHVLHSMQDKTWECELAKTAAGGLGWEVVLSEGALGNEPATEAVEEDEQLPYLRELIAQVPGLGEARAFTRAKRIAADKNLPVPASFEALTGPVLIALIVEVSKKIAELATETKEAAAA